MAAYPYPSPYPYGGYNPMQGALAPQGVTYPQQQTPPQQSQQAAPNGFTCRPVTSREEAVAAQTDYFSAGVVMPDMGHGMIYLKRFNQNTGNSDFLEFAYKPPEKPQEIAGQWAPLDAFNALAEKVAQLESAGRVDKEGE